MFKGKKVVSFVLVTVLIVSAMLTGCGKKSDDKGTNAAADKQPMKLHLFGPGKTDKYIKFEDRENYPVWQETVKLLKKANLEMEYEIVPFEQYETVIKTKMASGSNLPDIVNISALDNTTALNLAKQGVIVELNSLIEKYDNGNIKRAYDKDFPYSKKLNTSPNGKMYWFCNLHNKTYKGNQPAPVARTMLIRKDWLDKLSIPVPTTAQEYYEVLKKIRDKDANGNGKPDEVLAYNPDNFTGSIAQWFGLGTDITAVDVENKKVVSPWYQPGIKDYFKFLQQLVKAGILDTSLIGAKSEQYLQKVSEDKVASINDYNLEKYLEASIKTTKAEYLPLMPLKAVDSIQPAAQVEPPFLAWKKFAISRDCKDPKAAMAFFNVVYSEKYADLLFWGIEGETYKKNSDGVKVMINNGSNEEVSKNRKATGNQVFGDTVFPRVQYANLEYELDPTKLTQSKIDHEMKILNYKPYFVSQNNNYMAIPDDKQIEEKTKILNNLKTYSSELATKLALGQKSLDDWDKYMADFKQLGLDKLIEIDQQLLDRCNSIK